jgi:hypothetical protein
MFRKLFLCAIMCLLLVGAISAGANLPVLAGMGALTVLAFYAPTTRGERQG